ncbi:hypothetical protein CYMTET_51062 [Cymbomonas tetramitiformis]|uniref:Uncharacterized protein n=1 Tax=Cymbomonas tetramitiformis TaxID=36881 RepID=A0AAE0EU44_9CHLO|nr:hypothetical protein CYMTET_51062 [Cymbomonas tetramitiformis]
MEREQTDSAAVRTTPTKRRVAQPNTWARIRKRYSTGYRFRAPLKAHTDVCSPNCSKDCAEVLEEHRWALRAQLNDEYKPKEFGCPYFAEGEEFFKVKQAEYCERAPLNAAAFMLPPDTYRLTDFHVCWPFFRNTFGLGRRGKLVRKVLANYSLVIPSPPPLNPGAAKMKAKGLETFWNIKEHVKSFPRDSSHYSNNMAHGIARYFLAPDLYPAKLWQLYCKEHSVNFAAQAESLGWWRTLDSMSKKPANVLEFEEAGGVLIKPDVSYEWYLRRINTFDLRFGQVKVDTCDTCDSFKHQCAKAPSGSEEEKRVYSEWNAHRQRADKSYDSR